jgi:hypothetical protein
MLEQLEKMNAELQELKNKHLEMSKVMFNDIAKQLFEKHSILNSFGWVQYTPYFNDGDECTFSARTNYPTINGYDEDSENERGDGIDLISNSNEFITAPIRNEEDLRENEENYLKAGYNWYKDQKIGEYGVRKNPEYNPSHGEVIKDVKNFLSKVDESVLRNMFGDHVKITVSRNGVDVEDYEHD